MEELIWFSIPGALITGALVAIFPSLNSPNTNPVVLVLLAPVIGFIAHELFRLLFELTGGFARKSRTVIDYLMREIAPRENIDLANRESAFLVWEITFYSDDIPASFLSHDRGAWHYVLSFWGICMSTAIATIFCLIGYFFIEENLTVLYVAIVEAFIGLVFYWKGHTTYKSLLEQEIAFVKTHRGLLVKTLKELYGKPKSSKKSS